MLPGTPKTGIGIRIRTSALSWQFRRTETSHQSVRYVSVRVRACVRAASAPVECIIQTQPADSRRPTQSGDAIEWFSPALRQSSNIVMRVVCRCAGSLSPRKAPPRTRVECEFLIICVRSAPRSANSLTSLHFPVEACIFY